MMGYGGGFVEEGINSQNVDSPMKGRNVLQTLRPVTVKQLLEANPNGDSFYITNQDSKTIELGQVSIVACVRSLKETATGADYVLEDGTGSIAGKCWPDKAGEPVVAGNWARIHAIVRSMGQTRSLNILSIRPIGDHNQITMHLLQVIELSSSRSSKKSADQSAIGYSFLDDIQKAVYEVYAKSTSDTGLHYSSVVRSLASKFSPEQVRETITFLLSEGILYETRDSDHAKIIG